MKIIITLILTVLSTSIHAEKKKTIDLYIFAGQSNMRGIGKYENLPKEKKRDYPNVYIYGRGGEFQKYTPGKIFGPELGFADALTKVAPDQIIYIIKSAADGMPLHWGLDGGKWDDSAPSPDRRNFYPGKIKDDPNMGRFYKKVKSRVLTTLEKLEKDNVPFKLKGILWMQGEADAKHEVPAKEYAQSLKRLYEQLQIDLNCKGVPFVFGQVLPEDKLKEGRFSFRKALRQSQANAAHNSGHKDSIPNVWMVPTEGMPMIHDHVHFNAEGQFKLGTAMGEAMIKALKGQK